MDDERAARDDLVDPTGRHESAHRHDGRRRRHSNSRLSPKLSPYRQRLGRAAGGGRLTKPSLAHNPSIAEVTEESSPEMNRAMPAEDNYPGHPRIQVNTDEEKDQRQTEYTSLLPHRNKYSTRSYSALTNASSNSSGDNVSEASCGSAGDELSSNSSITSSMTRRQYITFAMIMASSLSSSFTVCLFPPFYPRIAEMKGATATDYGLIIGTNCLVAFLVTPFIGKHLSTIGLKFAFVFGMFGGGACCFLSGFLEFFQPGIVFICVSVLIRVFHAISNAMVITSTFTYTAMEFPASVARIFAVTRGVMNVAQFGGPMLGGLLYEAGGFACPFVIFGSMQVCFSLFSFIVMESPEQEDDDMGCDSHMKHKKKKSKVSVSAMLCIPTVWFSFTAFIIATVCNGFLSINLEPQVLRNFNLTPFYIGFFFGIKDGANSIASPIWGWICDKNRKSVKPFLVVSSVLVSMSFFLLGAKDLMGFRIQLTLPLLLFALCLNGAGIGGQQVTGVVDAMHEAAAAGYPDNPTTHGLIAGLWSSLSGAGRFISRGGSGVLVDQFGFSAVAAIVCSLQVFVAFCTFLYLTMCECSLASRDHRLRSLSVTIVEQGRSRDERVVFTTNCSPSESLMNHSVHVCIPNNCSGARMATRIANSMPPKKWNNYLNTPEQTKSRSIR